MTTSRTQRRTCQLLFILQYLPFGSCAFQCVCSLAISLPANINAHAHPNKHANANAIQICSNFRSQNGKTIVSHRNSVLREGATDKEDHHDYANYSQSGTFSHIDYESDLEESDIGGKGVESYNNNDHDDVNMREEDEFMVAVQMQTITDEEALLACRAYLQRKNKLSPSHAMPDGGWAQAKRRQRKLFHSLSKMDMDMDSNDTGYGYFWEDPNELRYLRTGRPRMKFDAKGLKLGGQIDELSDADADFLTFDAQITGSDTSRSNDNVRDLDDEVKDSLILEEDSGEKNLERSFQM